MNIELTRKNMMKKNTAHTLLRYPGGKFYALKLLEPFWKSVEHDEYREPFFGGGSVFWAKEKVKFNWINDKESELINLLDVIKNERSRNQLLMKFEGEEEATKEKYIEVKQMNADNELDRAYKYYYLNRTSFSGKMKNPTWGYRPKRSVPPYRWKEKIVPCGEKLRDVRITNLDYQELIFAPAKGKSVLMFVDPPYFNANQENHYICSFKKEDHLRLAHDLKNTPYYFFLTYDNCEEIKELYKWANIYEQEFFYRLDNSKDNENKRKTGKELVITNFEVKKNESF